MTNPRTGMRVVRSRSVPVVGTDRLLDDLRYLHDTYHTPEGLHAFNGPRRELVNNGRKIITIRHELRDRGIPTDITCRFCG